MGRRSCIITHHYLTPEWTTHTNSLHTS